ncbi:MAG TPA: lysoplasmalogenase family protein [Candidatus Hydrogenedentes bacterium]|nr:lysoplasmalogenase family protein [Candidatus Hydrogenedentota bacterium]
MDWYYAEGSKQIGPLDGRKMGLLVQQGTIKPDTLVWREGLPNWTAARKAAPNLFQGVPQHPQAPAQQPRPAGGGPSAPNTGMSGGFGLQGNLADSLKDMPGTSDLLGGLEDLSSLRGLAALEDSAGAGAAQRVGDEFICAACGAMKPGTEAVTFEGKILCKQCGYNLGKDGGVAYTDGSSFYKEKAKRHPVKDFMAFYGRNSRQFMAAGAVLGLLALFIVLRIAGAVGAVRYLQYPLAAAIIAVVYMGNGLKRPYGRTILIATVLTLAGEVFLFRGSGLFLLGALSFLAAHAAFLIAFWIRGFSLGWSIGAAIPLLGISAASYFWLHPQASVEMEVAMIGFGLVLTAMTVFGIATIGAGSSLTIILGVIAFYVSDILFARSLVYDLLSGWGNTLGAIPLRDIALLLFAFSISIERERASTLEAQARAAQAQPQPYDPLADL